MAKVLAVLVEQQDRAENPGARGRLDDADELAQRLFERAVADRQFEHPVVRGADRFIAFVAGDFMPLDEDDRGPPAACGERLEQDIDVDIFGQFVGAGYLHCHSMAGERFGGLCNPVEQIDKGLAGEFGHRLGHRLASEVVMSNEIAK